MYVNHVFSMFQFLAATSGLHIALSGCVNKSAFIRPGAPDGLVCSCLLGGTSILPSRSSPGHLVGGNISSVQPRPLGWRKHFFGASLATWLAEELSSDASLAAWLAGTYLRLAVSGAPCAAISGRTEHSVTTYRLRVIFLLVAELFDTLLNYLLPELLCVN